MAPFGYGFPISLGTHEPFTQSLGDAIDCAIGDGKFRTRIREHRIVERRDSGVQDCAGDSKVLSGLIPMQVHGDQHCAVLTAAVTKADAHVDIANSSGICVVFLDPKSVVKGKSVSVSVDLGGRRIVKKTKKSITKT